MKRLGLLLFLTVVFAGSAVAERAGVTVLPVRYLGPIVCDTTSVKSVPIMLDLSRSGSTYLTKLMPNYSEHIDLTPALLTELNRAGVQTYPRSRLGLRTTVAAIACSPLTETTAVALPLALYTYFSETVVNAVSVETQLIDMSTGEVLDSFVARATSSLDYSRHTFPMYFFHFENSTTPNFGELVREAMRATAEETARVIPGSAARRDGESR